MNTPEESNKRSREILGLLLFAIALFVIIALLSYNPHDPSFTHYLAGKVKIHNLGGKIGSYLADSFLRFFGIVAYFPPLALALVALKLFLGRMKAIAPR